MTEFHPQNPLIVQPNFEIVFLAPNLNAEVEIAPFAERCGQIILAASQGATAAMVLAALGKHSAKPVPANVTEEVKAWFCACRPLAVRRSFLFDTGDHETALRVKRILGAECTALSDTLLEWLRVQLDPKLRKKLTEQGLFLESGSSNEKS